MAPTGPQVLQELRVLLEPEAKREQCWSVLLAHKGLWVQRVSREKSEQEVRRVRLRQGQPALRA